MPKDDSGEQLTLFGGEWWEEYWQDMPEFVQEDKMPWKSVTVHFKCRQDMDKFAELTGHKKLHNQSGILRQKLVDIIISGG